MKFAKNILRKKVLEKLKDNFLKEIARALPVKILVATMEKTSEATCWDFSKATSPGGFPVGTLQRVPEVTNDEIPRASPWEFIEANLRGIPGESLGGNPEATLWAIKDNTFWGIPIWILEGSNCHERYPEATPGGIPGRIIKEIPRATFGRNQVGINSMRNYRSNSWRNSRRVS